jgi:DNA-binding XRE family transcriptional regulator
MIQALLGFVVRPGGVFTHLVRPPRLATCQGPNYGTYSQEQMRKDAVLSEAVSRPRRLFGHNLRRLRARAGLTQTALSELSGIKRARISEYESGLYACTIDMLERFAEAFDVPISALFDETDFDEKPKRKKR